MSDRRGGRFYRADQRRYPAMMRLIGGGGRDSNRIDRRALVGRHRVEVTGILPTSPLSVGNGELCYTVDVTGLQTFPGSYPAGPPDGEQAADPGPGLGAWPGGDGGLGPRGRTVDAGGPAAGDYRSGTLLGTMAQWAWHSIPAASRYDLAATSRAYRTPSGPVPYVDMRGELTATGEQLASVAEAWLRGNPHRLDLARIGLVRLAHPLDPRELSDVRQCLDLWTGVIESEFRLDGVPVWVTTACHPHRDVLAIRVRSRLLDPGPSGWDAGGAQPARVGPPGGPAVGGGPAGWEFGDGGAVEARLAVRLAFPYGATAWGDAADWSRPEAHCSTLRRTPRGCQLIRVLDATSYGVRMNLGPHAQVRQTGPHEVVVWSRRQTLDLVIAFDEWKPAAAELPTVAEVLAASQEHWARFWTEGGAVELADSRDQRAPELERRIVLSQYLTAIHCAGRYPPQETGLMVNSWRGRFHLEMHWWHGAHFPLWGRPELLERSLDWYARILPEARQTARRQGYAGARWPKQVGPDGREAPSPIGPFLIWQQPHPIFLAELIRRARRLPGDSGMGCDAPLRRYAEVVLATADFMADFATPGPDGYQLGPPLVPAQECYVAMRASVIDPVFELAYWGWALRVAVRWRAALGLSPEPRWEKVAERLRRPLVRDGVYPAIGVPPHTVLEDHPSMLYALGFVPPTDLIDVEVMRATLRQVRATWPWETTWGWDYPAVAMTAVRLGEPATALEMLLLPTPKNEYLPNGHNRQGPQLPAYLPGNGGLLSAVALMARGSDADLAAGRTTPGFPADGWWTVRHEGLRALP